MKGAIFIALNELIESRYGIETWDAILADVRPKCEGIYISTEDYPDNEINDFVLAITKRTSFSSAEVTRLFGRFLFDELNSKFPIFCQQHTALFPFLMSIENIIHKEVRKLYEHTSLPNIESTQIDAQHLLLKYHSPRKLCFLAEGLIQGAADFYNTTINIRHEKCMHEGHSQCEFSIEKKALPGD